MSSFPHLSYVCPIKWAEMRGDEHERFCAKCSRTVVNLSLLTEAERVALLKNSRPEDLCVAYYRRRSGEHVTAERPLLRKEARRIVQCSAAAIALGATATAVCSDPYADEKAARIGRVAERTYNQAKEAVLDRADRIAEALIGRPLRTPPVHMIMGMIACPPSTPATPPGTAVPSAAPSQSGSTSSATESAAQKA
jgi:hypothetical protein